MVIPDLQAYGFAELVSDTTVRLTELHYTGVGLFSRYLQHFVLNFDEKVRALIGSLARSLRSVWTTTL